MVALLRDGLRVSLDEFEAGTAKKPNVSPYDRDGDYRTLIALLETLRPGKRKKAVAVLTWLVMEMTDESDWVAVKESAGDVEHALRIGDGGESSAADRRAAARPRAGSRRAR
jgi:hypothetical protein